MRIIFKKGETHMKKCNTCKEIKSLSEFHKNHTVRDGHSNKCKKCTILYSRKYYESNLEKHRQYAREKELKRRSAGLCLACGAKSKYRKGYCKKCYDLRLSAHKTRRETRRDIVIQHYGGKCACCGEKEPRFLTLDHINNNGSEHRRSINRGQFYPWVIKNGFPNDLQLLCWNCNLGKYHNNGVCPHKERGRNEM
jgi:serine/threonine protein phosphatase PrpC